jgi:hypothetical protein
MSAEQLSIDDELYNLLFGVKRSARYHLKRRHFFERLGKFIRIFAAITGSAAFAAVVANSKTIALTFSALAGILSAMDLFIKCADTARLHAELAQGHPP